MTGGRTTPAHARAYRRRRSEKLARYEAALREIAGGAMLKRDGDILVLDLGWSAETIAAAALTPSPKEK